MLDRSQAEDLLVQHLPLVERLAASLARRSTLSPSECDDFSSWAKEQLIVADYAMIRKFRGESSFPAYLSAVLAHLVQEYRVARWGRWRSSVAAKRLGPIALRLERLVHRDGLTWREAATSIRSGGEVRLTDAQFAALFAQLPKRRSKRAREVLVADTDGLPKRSSTTSPADVLLSKEELALALAALGRALAELTGVERAMLRLKYWEDQTIVQIADTLQLDVKPLYRRFDRMYNRLRKQLIRLGVSADQIQSIITFGRD
jgi:RNA polymerase sigma factor (sigma-70 family)